MYHASQPLGGGGQQHIFDERPGCAVIHQSIAVLILAQGIFLFKIRQDHAGGFLDHGALPGIGDLEHLLLRRFGLLNPAGIGADKLRQIQNESLFGQRHQLPSSLMVGRRGFQPGVQNPLQNIPGNFPVLKLTNASSLIDYFIKLHLPFPPFPIFPD